MVELVHGDRARSSTRSASNLSRSTCCGKQRDRRASADDQAVFEVDHPSPHLGRDRLASGPDQAILESGGRPVGARDERPDPGTRSEPSLWRRTRSTAPTCGPIRSRIAEPAMADRQQAVSTRTQCWGRVALSLENRGWRSPGRRHEARTSPDRRLRAWGKSASVIARFAARPGWRSRARREAGSGWSRRRPSPLDTGWSALVVPSTSFSGQEETPRSPYHGASRTLKVRFRGPDVGGFGARCPRCYWGEPFKPRGPPASPDPRFGLGAGLLGRILALAGAAPAMAEGRRFPASADWAPRKARSLIDESSGVASLGSEPMVSSLSLGVGRRDLRTQSVLRRSGASAAKVGRVTTSSEQGSSDRARQPGARLGSLVSEPGQVD